MKVNQPVEKLDKRCCPPGSYFDYKRGRRITVGTPEDLKACTEKMREALKAGLHPGLCSGCSYLQDCPNPVLSVGS